MKKQIFTWMFLLALSIGHAQTKSVESPTGVSRDSVAYRATFYYPLGANEIATKDYKKADRLTAWAKNNPRARIIITGWADKSGTKERNSKISLRRAQTVRDYLVKHGVAATRISFKGNGVDKKAINNEKARRADARGVIRITVAPKKTQPQPKQVVVPQPVIQNEPKQEVVELVQEQPIQVVEAEVIAPVKKVPAKFRWYAGVEGGVPFGVSTLTSFAHGKTYAGWQAGVMGGYRISPLLSAEVGITFGQLKLGASKCCEDYVMGADGLRYLIHVAGMDNYPYKDMYSSVSMQQYALRLNVDMLQIANPDWNKRWSLAISPAIYGINTKATLKSNTATIVKRNGQFQFGAGVGIGAGYQITKNFGVGLRSGAAWVFGKRYDGIEPTDHKENMIWNNTITLMWRFGCSK